MKKIINIVAVCIFAIAMTACGGNSSDPVKIAEEFATAYLNADYDKCNKMMEDEEFTPAAEMSSMEKAVTKSMKEEAGKMQYVLTFDETDAAESSYPYVYFDITSKTNPDFKETIRVNLAKNDDGKWIVDSYKAF